MAQSDAFKKYLDAGMAFTELTRKRAERIVKDLVAAGELQQKQTRDAIDDLVDRSRKNAEAIGDLVRAEVTTQLASVGIATQADIARIEAKVASLGGSPTATSPAPSKPAPAKQAPKPAPAGRPAPAKPVAAKVVVPKKVPAKSSSASVTSPVKPAVQKAPAKPAPFKKAVKKA